MRARASFVIPTRGRVELVVDLVKSIERQTTPTEVLIMDDGGSSELADMLRRDFPAVQYHSLGTGRGPGFQRNRGIELATADAVFAIDDDTVLPSANTVQQTLAEFSDPRIAAVAIPYANVRYETLIRHRAPDQASVWVNHAFTGASHAVRRSAFLEAGGYREHFFYMGEEGDLCLRLLNRGYVVRVGAADPIHHLESPLRNSALADFCGRRNDLAFAWHNVPSSRLPLHLLGTTRAHLVVRFKGRRTDIGTHSVVLRWTGPEEGALVERWRTDVGTPPAGATEMDLPLIAAIDLPIETTGAHTMTIALDGARQADITLQVRSGPAVAAAGDDELEVVEVIEVVQDVHVKTLDVLHVLGVLDHLCVTELSWRTETSRAAPSHTDRCHWPGPRHSSHHGRVRDERGAGRRVRSRRA